MSHVGDHLKVQEKVVLCCWLVGHGGEVVGHALGKGRLAQDTFHHPDHTATLLVGEHAELTVHITPETLANGWNGTCL